MSTETIGPFIIEHRPGVIRIGICRFTTVAICTKNPFCRFAPVSDQRRPQRSLRSLANWALLILQLSPALPVGAWHFVVVALIASSLPTPPNDNCAPCRRSQRPKPCRYYSSRQLSEASLTEARLLAFWVAQAIGPPSGNREWLQARALCR